MAYFFHRDAGICYIAMQRWLHHDENRTTSRGIFTAIYHQQIDSIPSILRHPGIGRLMVYRRWNGRWLRFFTIYIRLYSSNIYLFFYLHPFFYILFRCRYSSQTKHSSEHVCHIRSDKRRQSRPEVYVSYSHIKHSQQDSYRFLFVPRYVVGNGQTIDVGVAQFFF